MNVLFVVDEFPLSREMAKVPFVVEEARQLVRKGVNVTVVTRSRKQHGKTEFDGISIYAFNPSNEGLSLKWLRFTRAIKVLRPIIFSPHSFLLHVPWAWFTLKIAQKVEADLIHGHFACPGGYVAALTSKVLRKPFVVTLRGVDIQVEPSVEYGLMLEPKVEEMIKLVLDESDAIIAVSKQIADEAFKLMDKKTPHKIYVINNAVDTLKFTPHIPKTIATESTGLPVDRPIILSLGRFHPKKGYGTLINAASYVVKTHAQSLFVIAGKDRGEKAKLQSLTSDLGLEDNVLLMDEISPELVPYYYAMCELFVLPSIVEGFPNVVLEAMASGKPVVATKVGGIEDLIKDGLNGFAVDVSSDSQLAERISLLLDDRELREKLSQAARKTIEENFHIERKIDEIMEVYNRVTHPTVSSP